MLWYRGLSYGCGECINEKMYSAIGVLRNLDPHVTVVGIPKAKQNRNLDVVRAVECENIKIKQIGKM